MSQAKRLPPPGDERRYTFAELPCCPGCGLPHLKAYRTTRDGDEKYQHAACESCGAKTIIVWTCPESGKQTPTTT